MQDRAARAANIEAPPWTLRPRRGPKPAFTRDDILRCAAAILDREGHEALTFRAIAAALKTSHQALYNYFESLAELEDQLAARLIAAVQPLSAARPDLLREQLVRLGLDLVHTFSLHPYLREISGPAAAAVTGRLHGRNDHALMSVGIEFWRAHTCQLMLQLVASGLGLERHRRRAVPQPAWRSMNELYLQQLARELPDRYRRALTNAARGPQEERALIEVIVDAVLPELKRNPGRR